MIDAVITRSGGHSRVVVALIMGVQDGLEVVINVSNSAVGL